MESSPAAAVAPRPSRDPLLFGNFDLPAGWGCRKPMAFCRGTDNPASASAAAGAKNGGPRSPAKAQKEEEEEQQQAQAQAPEAPRRQWNLRERAPGRDYRAEDARQAKNNKPGAADAKAGQRSRGFSVALARQEIDADFVAITGRKAPRRPKKRAKAVQRPIETLFPGSSLVEVTRDRYKVNEKGGF